jgi:threonine aldolase
VGLNNLSQLATDNANAKVLASKLNEVEGLTVEEPDSNLVYVTVLNKAAGQLVGVLESAGVLCFALGESMLRMVTHLEVKETDLEGIVKIVKECVERVAKEIERNWHGEGGGGEEYGSWNTN